MIEQFFKNNSKPNPEEPQKEFIDISKSIKRLEQSIDKPVSVENFDEVKLHLRKELGILAKAIEGIVKSIPKTVIPPYPDSLNIGGLNIRIGSLEQLVARIDKACEMLSQIEYNPNITVEAPVIPEIKIPEIKVPKIKIPKIDVPEAQVTVNPNFEFDFSEILEKLKPLKFLSNRASTPLSVRLSDGMNFVKELKKLIGEQGKWVTAFSQSKGMDEDEYEKKAKKVFIPTSLTDGRKTVTSGGTAEQLTTTSVACKFVILVGETNNTNPVTVGGSTVVGAEATRRGIPIYPAQQVKIEIDDPSKLYLDVITDTEGVTYAVFK